MNIPEYIQLAKKVLNEDAGSEGMVYKIIAKSGLKSIKNDELEIKDVKSTEGIQEANINFAYPHDYGFAIQAIEALLPDLDFVSMSLVY